MIFGISYDVIAFIPIHLEICLWQERLRLSRALSAARILKMANKVVALLVVLGLASVGILVMTDLSTRGPMVLMPAQVSLRVHACALNVMRKRRVCVCVCVCVCVKSMWITRF